MYGVFDRYVIFDQGVKMDRYQRLFSDQSVDDRSVNTSFDAHYRPQ